MWTILFGPSGCGKILSQPPPRRLRPPLAPRNPLHSLAGKRSLRPRSARRNHLRRAPSPRHPLGRRKAMPSSRTYPSARTFLFGSTAPSAFNAKQRNTSTQIITIFQLQPLLNRLPRDLSGGERRRVALLPAPLPPLQTANSMLLDEPILRHRPAPSATSSCPKCACLAPRPRHRRPHHVTHTTSKKPHPTAGRGGSSPSATARSKTGATPTLRSSPPSANVCVHNLSCVYGENLHHSYYAIQLLCYVCYLTSPPRRVLHEGPDDNEGIHDSLICNSSLSFHRCTARRHSHCELGDQ